MRFEICANSVESCIAARDGGAQRVELCAGLSEGGTTPSYGEIALAREIIGIKLHVIIRPRGGDFHYSCLEVRTMLKDIEMARSLGVDGVVFGALHTTGRVDKSAMQELIAASNGLSKTFHRAFDVCLDPFEALEEIIDLGCDRILTSGQAQTAEAGIGILKKLQNQANGRITIMAGCGVNRHNINRIACETGIREFHFSAHNSFNSLMTHRNPSVSMSNILPVDEYQYSKTTAAKVKEIIDAATSSI